MFQLLTGIGLGVATLTPALFVNVLHHVSVLVAVLVTVLTLPRLVVLLAVVADPSICSEVGFVVGLEIFLVISPSPEDLSMAVVEVETVVVSESLVYPAEVDGVSG